MKRLCALVLAAVLMMTMMLVLDSPLCRADDENELFETVWGDGWTSYKIVYCKETKVMYAISNGFFYNIGTFTLLVNADGSPMVWEGE